MRTAVASSILKRQCCCASDSPRSRESAFSYTFISEFKYILRICCVWLFVWRVLAYKGNPQQAWDSLEIWCHHPFKITRPKLTSTNNLCCIFTVQTWQKITESIMSQFYHYSLAANGLHLAACSVPGHRTAILVGKKYTNIRVLWLLSAESYDELPLNTSNLHNLISRLCILYCKKQMMVIRMLISDLCKSHVQNK